MEPNDTQPEVTTEAPATAPDSGAEKRIAELTAQKHELERQYAARFEEQSKQVADLIAAVGRMQSPQVAPAPVEVPPFDLDPDEVKKYEYIANKVMGPRIAQMQAQQQAYQQQQAQLVFQQVASRETNAEVTAEAQKLWNYWQQAGKTGFVIADAFTFARGTILERQQAARGAEQRFGGNDPSATVVTGHPQPPPLASGSTTKAFPKNFDSLPWEDQERIYLEVLGNEPL